MFNTKEFDEADFKEINYEDLENDPELLAELKELGWEQQPKVIQKKSTPKEIPLSKNQPTINDGDFDAVLPPEYDESDLTFTEDDENDPDLLNSLAALSHEPLTKVEPTDDTLRYSNVARESFNLVETKTTSEVSEQLMHDGVKSQDYIEINTTSIEYEKPMKLKEPNDPVREAKLLAAKCKQGDLEGAMNYLRKAKILEKSNNLKTTSSSSSSETPKQASMSRKGLEKKESINQSKVKSSQVSTMNISSSVSTMSSSSSTSATGVSSSSATTVIIDIFAPLEKALTEASQMNLNLAKEYKTKNDNIKAIYYMKEYKKYLQELDVLNARKIIPGAMPALFQWKSIKTEKIVQYIDIGEDQLKLEIHRLTGLQSVIQKYNSRSIYLTYDLSLPKDTPITGKIIGNITSEGQVDFNFSTIVSAGIKRTTLTANSISRKKCQFDIYLKRGFLFSDIHLGQAFLSYSELVQKCTCHGNVTFTLEDENKKKKVTGYQLEVDVTLRTPLVGKEITVTEERILVIDPWPSLNTATMNTTIDVTSGGSSSSILMTESSESKIPVVSTTSYIGDKSKDASSNRSSTSSTNSPPKSTTKPTITTFENTDLSPAKSKDGDSVQKTTSRVSTPIKPQNYDEFDDLSDIEKKDPDNVLLLMSSDVMDKEIDNIKTLLTQPSLDPDNKLVLTTRLDAVTTRLDTLVRSVQDEKISLSDYVLLLKERVSKDIRVMKYLTSKPADDRDKVIEKKIMTRIQVMRDEIQGVESSQSEA